MFDVKKFGANLAKLRKNKDMTQSELSDILNITRQAVSKYENGDSFPDISILLILAETFNVTLDTLINAGEPTKSEATVLTHIALGKIKKIPSDIFKQENISNEIINIAPYLKASTLDIIANKLAIHGINISKVVALAEYMNDKSVVNLLRNATFEQLDEEVFEKFIPFLDSDSKEIIFEKILNGELNYNLISIILPYAEYLISQIEAAVIDGALDKRALKIISDYVWKNEKWRKGEVYVFMSKM